MRVRLPQYGTSRTFESAGMDNYHARVRAYLVPIQLTVWGQRVWTIITPRVSAYHNMVRSGSTQRVWTIITTTVGAYHIMGRFAWRLRQLGQHVLSGLVVMASAVLSLTHMVIQNGRAGSRAHVAWQEGNHGHGDSITVAHGAPERRGRRGTCTPTPHANSIRTHPRIGTTTSTASAPRHLHQQQRQCVLTGSAGRGFHPTIA